ncbi:MAG: SDR family oxidoreductase [Acidiferrobacterales bacterium]|nr:SDR family oxidoreductase [Acidiferrobacterales bacterium]
MAKELWHKDKTAIVTGGTSGIGFAIAQTLLARGANVAVGSRQPSADEHSLEKQGFFVGQLDVCQTPSVQKFVDQVRTEFGEPDILVNAAGVSVHHEVCGHSDEDWDGVIETNLNGPFKMTRACLPAMMSNQWGRIVNIASTAASTAVATHAAYCASKAGLLGLTRAVALEGADSGVTCTAVSPTWVETEMLRSSIEKMAKRSGQTIAEQRAEIASANPQNRLVQPEEIAELVSFLCSNLSPALTMEDVQVNAGAHW